MAVINITDEAHQFRIDIEGRLSGRQVGEVRACWLTALDAASWRKFTVDISQLSGYDIDGCRLLREMHTHGAYVAARTPGALVFLHEISKPELSGPTLVSRAEKHSKRNSQPAAQKLTRTVAAGE